MPSTVFRKLVLAIAFGIAFVINPAYVAGCGSTEQEGPRFGEAEMVALLEDFNAMGVPVIEVGQARYALAIELSQSEGDDHVDAVSRAPALLASTAHACGDRTFMKSAAACSTRTTMTVEGTLTVHRVDGEAPVVVVEDLRVSGAMTVDGNLLTYADVDLELEGGGSASWHTRNGRDFDVALFDAQGLGEDGVDIQFERAE
jgi:hypothetical protein